MARRSVVDLALPLAFGFVLAVFTACKGEPSRPPLGDDGTNPIGSSVGGGGGSSVTDGGLVDSGLDGGICTAIDLGGSVVDVLTVGDDPPPGIGGVIADGTYTITDAKLYAGIGALPGANGTTYQGSIRITNGTTFERNIVFTSSNAATQTDNVSGILVIGTATGTATISLACPAASTESITYSVTGTNLTITDTTSRVTFAFALSP